MTSHANPTYELKALVLAPDDATGREWCASAGLKDKEVRVGTEARQFKGYPRDLPIYILHTPGHPKMVEHIDQVRRHFRITREIHL